MITVTRKIKIYPTGDKEQVNESWKAIWSIQRLVHRAANLISTHQFAQEGLKDMIYLADGTKMKLGNILNDDDGMLICSRDNTTYQVCSDNFKGEVPMDIMTCLNMNVVKNYKAERNDVFFGNRSLRTYKKFVPIPFSAKSLKIQWNEEKKNFDLSLFGINFLTYLGRDLSGNKTIVERCLSGEYKMCNSSIKICENRNINGKDEESENKGRYSLCLMLCVQFEKEKAKLKEKNVLEAHFDTNFPVVLKRQKDATIVQKIGSKEDYLYKRLQIQQKLHDLQVACQYNTGGHGRSHKMQAIDRFKLKEKNYIQTKLHTYSSQIINYAVTKGYGKIVLVDIDEKIEQAKKDEFILRNWTYYGFLTLLSYKAAREGVILDAKAIKKTKEPEEREQFGDVEVKGKSKKKAAKV